MPTYCFYEKSLVRTVEVNRFRVRADSYRAALGLVRTFTEGDVDNHLHEDYIDVAGYETCIESSTKLDPLENDGKPTISIYNDRDELIAHNACPHALKSSQP